MKVLFFRLASTGCGIMYDNHRLLTALVYVSDNQCNFTTTCTQKTKHCSLTEMLKLTLHCIF